MWRKLEINKWDKFNRLTIIKEIEQIWLNRYVQCKCDCWDINTYQLWSIRGWFTKSCWCLHKDTLTTHWMKGTKIYEVWINLKKRCNNKSHKSYKNYGWRWITYDPKWQTFEWFYEDMKEWYSDNLQIDRIDNDWHYCKENCKWSTRIEQQRNKRNNRLYKWKTFWEWCEELWLNIRTVKNRVYKLKWTDKQALWFEKRL